LDGDAAKGMDFLLNRLSGWRKQWEKAESPASPATALPWSEAINGIKVALQVDPVTWPLHTQDGKPFSIVLKLHVKNVSDRPVSLHDWRNQPGAILLAYAFGKLVEWGGGSNTVADPGKGEVARPVAPVFDPLTEKIVGPAAVIPPVDVAAGQTHVFEKTVRFDNGRLHWPILSGGIYYWPFQPNQKLAPGEYQLRGIYEMGSPSWWIEAISTVKVKVVVDVPAPAMRPAP
jgi:hypothetical protein